MLGTTERSRAKDAARLSMVSRSFEAISMGSMSSEKRDMARFVTFSTPFSNLSRNPMDSTSPNVVWRPPGWSRETGLSRLAMGLHGPACRPIPFPS